VAEYDSQDQAIEYLEESVRDVFEEHLDRWYGVPAVWPKKRDPPPFQRWVEFGFHSMIVDLCDDVLEHEELLIPQEVRPRVPILFHARLGVTSHLCYSGHTRSATSLRSVRN
jgi:hypothetical protein